MTVAAREIDASFDVPYRHALHVARGVFDPGNPTLAGVLEPTTSEGRARVFACVDAGFFDANADLPQALGDWLTEYADRVELAGEPLVLPGGEASKNEPEVIEQLVAGFDDAKLCRRSYVIAIGGGAVLDAAGYAASLFHRGVRLVRIPTTTLAQADSAVGVKNAVNARGKKNLLGTFAVPSAVINDAYLLQTLADEHWRAGFAEAVKVALIKEAELFESIASSVDAITERDLDACEPIITRSAKLHLSHITDNGDPFEQGASRPLDFGHWSAHRLEEITGFELTHGDAVAIGIAIDCAYATALGLIAPDTATRTVTLLESLGFDLDHDALDDADSLLAGIESFREHVGGDLALTMPQGLGNMTEVNEFHENALRDSIAAVRARAWVTA